MMTLFLFEIPFKLILSVQHLLTRQYTLSLWCLSVNLVNYMGEEAFNFLPRKMKSSVKVIQVEKLEV